MNKHLKTQARKTGRDLPALRVGQPVLVEDALARKTQWTRGRCVDQLSDRSYVVEVDGRFLRRNRRFLRPTGNPPNEQTDQPDGQWEAEDLEIESNSPEPSTTVEEETAPTQREPESRAPTIPVPTARTRSGRHIRQPVRFSDYVK